jgi:hypothetical protein
MNRREEGGVKEEGAWIEGAWRPIQLNSNEFSLTTVYVPYLNYCCYFLLKRVMFESLRFL